ncbi:zinc finger homeobox protein 2 [Malaclemys terrapin pileata]|uniref:zinc finger homeobox protein 2 n=1 Tax=Malaclemys terrapin pileata TaxID=2991368 RepID=UPI0023A901D2|nr:zinc finger homeobox protein 2 [Malaclemys terrapin pileata]
MDAPSNSASSSSSSAPTTDGQDARAAGWPPQDPSAPPATKEPSLPDRPSTSPSPAETMRPSPVPQPEPGPANLPAAILSAPQLQAGFGLVAPSPSLLHPSAPREDAKEEEEEEGNDDDEEDEEDGGSTAHLLFFPDGSAYLLSGGHVLLPKGYPGATATLPVSTLHVQDGGPNQGFTSTDQMSQNTSAPGEQPPSGAFRRYRLARASAPTTSAKNSPTEPKDAVTDGEGEAKVGQEEEPSWPPWLCLACCLSFRQGRSLASHALSAHGVRLSPGERRALSQGVPAVLQGTALSFLEPNNPPSGVDLSAGMCSGWVNVMKEEEEERSPREGRKPPDAKDSRAGGVDWANGGEEEEQQEEKAEGRKEEGDGLRLLPDQSSHGQSPPRGTNVPDDPLSGKANTELNNESNSESNVGLANSGVNSNTGGVPLGFGDDYTAMAYPGLSLSGHMSLLHSRNSCKTLKCPKCNWHYKYQQTLDVHMKEKHPESNSHCAYCSAGGPHPRLARGESYNCGYKPYRCEACNYSTTTKGNLSIHMQSDKHLANLQGFQANTSGGAQPVPPATPTAPTPVAPEEKETKSKTSWQCKVCSYETGISRNLRIHMTSEKHMQNVLLLHQGLPLALPGLLGQPGGSSGGKQQPQTELFQFYGVQALGHHHGHHHAGATGAVPGLRVEKPMDPAQLLLNGFHPLGPAGRKGAVSAPGKGLRPFASHPPAAPVPLSPSPCPPPPLAPASPPLAALVASERLFGCLVCQRFGTDSVEELLRHSTAPRRLPEAEWKEVAGDLHRCRLCAYGTQLKANFQLHLKTDKHAHKYQLAAHLREGGGALPTATPAGAELQPGPAPAPPPLHLRCNLCDYETNSKEKMRLHVRGAGHEEGERSYKFLLELEASALGPDPPHFHCLLCNTTAPSCLAMLCHLRAPRHRDAHGQHRLHLLQGGRPTDEGTMALERCIRLAEPVPRSTGKESNSEPRTPEKETLNKAPPPGLDETETKSRAAGETQTTVFCCPYCSYVSRAPAGVRSHAVSQHALQPTYRCPLCQEEQLVGRGSLRVHLSHVHNVVPECVEKLLLVATTVEMNFATKVLPSPSPALEPPETGAAPNPECGGECELAPTAPPAGDAATSAPLPPAPSPPPADDPEEEAAVQLPAPSEEQQRPPETSPALQDPRHPLSYRKATNFALDKFLDPSRPYKCTVCKESFTQKNILLVHYNSVSHLHKMKKASSDPTAPSRGDSGAPGAPQPSSDKPYKCTTCRVSYNQSSTLEIHMRSVLHQTRSRVVKAEAASKGEAPEAGEVGEAAPAPPTEAEPPKILEVPTALPFPAPLFSPPLLPPFPVVPESLLKLQQQQLLLPFYLHDLKGAPKLALAAPALALPAPSAPLILAPPKEPPPPPPPPPPAPAKLETEEDAGGEEANVASHPAAKALLENFGFELVIQYNEGKQGAGGAAPPPVAPLPRPPAEKLRCGTCGKVFSNMLILKTHEEHVHRRFLPFEALSRYAAQFRKTYDSMYPPAEGTAPTETPPVPPGITPLCPPFLMQPVPVVVPPALPEAEGRWVRGEEEEAGTDPSRDGQSSRRFSRTKFTEFQSQALQSFFEASAYPKDGEVERLSVLLGLANRVIVVWFQNARQKARKNGAEAGGAGGGTVTSQPSCKKCQAAFRCIFDLVRHLKKCYDDQPSAEGNEEEEEEEGEEEPEEEEPEEEPEPPAEEEEEEEEEEAPRGDGDPKEDQPVSDGAMEPLESNAPTFSSDPPGVHGSAFLAPHDPLPELPHSQGAPMKRKHEDGSQSPGGGSGGEGDPPRDKRLRTTILPEQLDILYRWYVQDSNPTRKMLDCISEEVGLKKRVVQVWFQNTRARERKGQFRCSASTGIPPIKTSPSSSLAKLSPGGGMANVSVGGTPNLSVGGTSKVSSGGMANISGGGTSSVSGGRMANVSDGVSDGATATVLYSSNQAEPEPSELNEARSPSGGDLSDSSSSSSSSLADPESPGGHGPASEGAAGLDLLGQRRYRTQMSSLQLKIMKACYEAYRTPTMQECEVLGEEIGLPKRVIQVWFQNARAKEKKAKAALGEGGPGAPSEGPPEPRAECPVCQVKYDFYVSCRGHLFSRGHLAQLKEAVQAQLRSEGHDGAPGPPLLPVPPGAPPAAGATGPSAAPSTGLLGSTPSGRPLPQSQLGSAPEPAGETQPEPGAAGVSVAGTTRVSVAGAARPPSTVANPTSPTLKTLKGLKPTVPTLLGTQFLPFSVPAGAPASLFSAPLPGGYFQQLYGMKKGLFPMNPVIPQTLISLLPAPEAPEPAGVSTVDVAHRYLCRQCKAAFEGEEAAAAHQASFCYYGQPAPAPLRVPVCTYHCLACEVLVSGREALGAHLRSSAHRRKASPAPAASPAPGPALAFAKEEAKLPHSDPSPKSNSTSTTLLAL